MSIVGQGEDRTELFKTFPGGVMFQSDGSLGDNLILQDFCCFCAGGVPGYFAYLSAKAPYAADDTHLRNLRITSLTGGLWYCGVTIDGTGRITPQGVREVVIEDVEIFNTTTASIYAMNAVNLVMRGGGCYPADGPLSGCGIYISGGGQPSEDSTLCFFSDVNNNGVLDITNSFACSYRGGQIGSLNTDGASKQWIIDTICTGPVYNNLGSDSRVTLTPAR